MESIAVIESLWDFSLTLYSQPGIESLCLTLQDDHAANVNIILFARWLEIRGVALDVVAALHQVDDWDADYVRPLRQLRRKMKQEFADRLEQVDTVRECIKQAELYAERQQLQWLAQMAMQWPFSLNLATGDNLRAYFAHLHLPDATASIAVQKLTNLSLHP